MSEFLDGVEKKYDQPKLLKNRLTTEGNVIAILYSDPCYFDECNFKESDFITKDGSFYFKIGKYLRNKGCTVLDEVAMLSKLPDDTRKAFENRGGYDEIRKMTEVVNTKNADVYFDDLHKENILLGLYREGFNLFQKTTWKDKEVYVIDLLRNFDSQGVLDWYESKLTSFDTGSGGIILEEEDIDFTDEFFEECAEGDNDGVPFEVAGEDEAGEIINCYKFLSKQVSGLRPKTLSMMGGFSSTGKSTWFIALILALLNQGEKIILISNEEEIKKYKIKLLVWILNKRNHYYNLTKKKLMSGEITDEDMKQLKSVQKWWRDKGYKKMLHMVAINDSDFATAKKLIRKHALNKGFSTFILDTFKIEQSDMNNARTDLALVRDSRELSKLAGKYNMIGLASVQLAESLKGTLFLTAGTLSNAKQLKEICENLFLMRNAYKEEFDEKSKFYCQPFRLNKVGNEWKREKFIVDPDDVWRILFVEKNRNGANSSDNGEAYLLKFMGDYATFIEKAKCRPKHGRIE